METLVYDHFSLHIVHTVQTTCGSCIVKPCSISITKCLKIILKWVLLDFKRADKDVSKATWCCDSWRIKNKGGLVDLWAKLSLHSYTQHNVPLTAQNCKKNYYTHLIWRKWPFNSLHQPRTNSFFKIYLLWHKFPFPKNNQQDISCRFAKYFKIGDSLP